MHVKMSVFDQIHQCQEPIMHGILQNVIVLLKKCVCLKRNLHFLIIHISKCIFLFKWNIVLEK